MGKIVRTILQSAKKNPQSYLQFLEWLFEEIASHIGKINGIASSLSAQASELAHSFFVSLFAEYQDTYFQIELTNLTGIVEENSLKVLAKLDRSRGSVTSTPCSLPYDRTLPERRIQDEAERYQEVAAARTVE